MALLYPIAHISDLLLVEESCRKCHAAEARSTRPIVKTGERIETPPPPLANINEKA